MSIHQWKGYLGCLGVGHEMSRCQAPSCSLCIPGLHRSTTLWASQRKLWLAAGRGSTRHCHFLHLYSIATDGLMVSFCKIWSFLCSLCVCIFTTAPLGHERRHDISENQTQPQVVPPSFCSEIRSFRQTGFGRNLESISTDYLCCRWGGSEDELFVGLLWNHWR